MIDKNCGIYKITSPTGKIYIGQAVDLNRRTYGYNYPSTYSQQPRLKRSLDKYGWNEHQIDFIEYCSEEELNCSERFWQDEFDVLGKNGLNCVLQECGEERRVYTEEFCKNISERMKGDKNPNWGKKISKETIEKRYTNPNRKIIKGIKRSEETIQMMKDNHYDCSGGKNSKAKITLDLETGIYYDCLKEGCIAKCLNYDDTKAQLNTNNNIVNNTMLIYADEKSLALAGVRIKKKQSKEVENIQTGKVYKSIKEASKMEKINYHSLKKILSGGQKNTTNLRLKL